MLNVAIRSSSRSVHAIARGAVRAAAAAPQQRSLSCSSRSLAEAVADSTVKAAGASTSSVTAASPKISEIVDQIEKLTLLEAAELVTVLKERLNIQEIAMPAASAAPVAAAAAPSADAAEQEEKPKEKTVFTLMLKGLKDASAKAKVIKEIKALNSNMNLVEAKKFVESAPQVLKEGLTKDEAEKLQKAIEAAGGLVERE